MLIKCENDPFSLKNDDFTELLRGYHYSKYHKRHSFTRRNMHASDGSRVWEKKFERDMVDTSSTPRVFWVRRDLPDPISYYMKGKLERTN